MPPCAGCCRRSRLGPSGFSGLSRIRRGGACASAGALLAGCGRHGGPLRLLGRLLRANPQRPAPPPLSEAAAAASSRQAPSPPSHPNASTMVPTASFALPPHCCTACKYRGSPSLGHRPLGQTGAFLDSLFRDRGDLSLRSSGLLTRPRTLRGPTARLASLTPNIHRVKKHPSHVQAYI